MFFITLAKIFCFSFGSLYFILSEDRDKNPAHTKKKEQKKGETRWKRSLVRAS